MPTKPIPEGYHSLNPYLAVDDAAAAIEFYKSTFGATERTRMPGPDGKIGHAELEIGDSILMLSDPFPQSSYKPPKELGGTSVGSSLAGTGSDIPVPRLSNRTRRENDARRSKPSTRSGSSHASSTCETQPGTYTRSTGPSPTTW